MRYLAIKNKDGSGKAVCICNTSDELDDLASIFRDYEWKVFEEYERTEALKWAGLNKISGFKLEEKSGFEKTLELFRYKGFSCVKLNLLNKETLIIALDDIYYISTDKLLTYNLKTKSLVINNYGYFAYPEDLVKEINEYYIRTRMVDKIDAIEDYMEQYSKQIGPNVYQCIQKTEATVNDNIIFVENAYSNITKQFDDIYYCSKAKDTAIPITSILSIEPMKLNYEIQDEEILDVLKRI